MTGRRQAARPPAAVVEGLEPLDSDPYGITQWRALTNSHFVALDVHPLCPPKDFVGRARWVARGSLGVFRLEHSAAIVARTPLLISRDSRDSELIKVTLQVEGEAFIEQDGRVALLHAGDLVLYDTSRPYTLRFDTDVRIVVLSFPHSYLGIPREELALVTATAFPHESPLGAVVNTFLARLAQSLEALDEQEGERLAQTALDLLATVVSGELRRGVPQDPKRQLRNDVLSSIEQMLPDPDLSPAQVAARHFISTRHLHSLFADQGMTVGSWIRQRRLEHIRRDLADPLRADVPVAKIAADWGLMNAAHFSRVFRATFGVSPSEYRRTRGLAPAPDAVVGGEADTVAGASEGGEADTVAGASTGGEAAPLSGSDAPTPDAPTPDAPTPDVPTPDAEADVTSSP